MNSEIKKTVDEIWLSTLKVAAILSITKKAVRKRKDLVKRESTVNGQKGYEYLLSSLPSAAQKKYFEQNKTSSQLPSLSIDNLPAEIKNKLNGDVQKYNNEFGYRELNPKQESQAKARFEIVKDYEKFVDVAEFGEIVKRKELYVRLYNNSGISNLERVGKIKSYKTIDEWIKKLEESDNDISVLVRCVKSRKGSSVPAQQIALIAGRYCRSSQPKMSEALDEGIELIKHHNLSPVFSYSTYKRVFKKWISENHPEVTVLRKGDKALKDEVAPSVIRNNDKLSVGDEISCDGKRCNFFINVRGVLKRPTVTLFQDVHSGFVLAHSLSINENVESSNIGLFRTILRLGKKPITIVPDRGSAFKGDFKINVLRLGIRYEPARAYNAKSKNVERTNLILEKFERWLPSYCGNSIMNRPAHLKPNEPNAVRRHKDHYGDIVIDFETASYALAKFLDIINNSIIKEGKNRRKTRREVFDSGKGPGVNKEHLIFLMMKQEFRKASKNGIKINGQFYWHQTMYGKMREYNVRYDPFYSDSVYLFDSETDEFICEAFLRNKIHPRSGSLGDEKDMKKFLAEINMIDSLHKHTFANAEAFYNEIVGPVDRLHMQKYNLFPETSGIKSIPQGFNMKEIEEVEAVVIRSGTNNEVIEVESKEDKPKQKLKMWWD